MSSQAVRAGAAFVEVLMKDESVQRSLADLKLKFAAFGATVNATGSQSFAAMNTASTTALAATTASAATATAGTALIGSAVYATANAFRVLFTTITTGVTKAAFSLRGIGYIVRDIFPKGGVVQNAFDKFLNSSGTMEKAGRWGRLVGAVTGSRFTSALGIRLERMGMGAAIEKGFRDGGFAGFLKSYIGAGFRSIPSFLTGIVASGVTAPFRLAFGTIRGGAAATAQSIAAVSSVTGGIGAEIAKATVPVRSFTGAALTLASAIPRIAMAAAKMGGIAALITGPALLAAKGFASAADEIIAKSKETGQSVQSLIQEKYGTFSFIKPEDIEAGAKMSQAMKEMKQQVAAAFAQLGIAALPVLRSMTDFMKNVMAVTTRYIAENRQLISTVIQTAAKIGSIAAAVAAAAAAFPMVVSAIGMLLSPIGLVAAALAGLVYFFPQIRQAAADAFNFLMPNFGELLTVVNRTMTGIFDALQGGSIKAAADVLWAGLELAWLLGTERLREIFRTASNNIASIGVDAFSGLRMAWQVTADFISEIWANLVAGMKSVWTTTQNAIAGGFARVIAKMTGQDVNEVLATLNEMQGQDAAKSSADFTKEKEERAKLSAQAMKDIEEQRKGMQESLKEELDGQNAAAKAGLDAARQKFKESTDAAKKLKEDAIASQAFKGADKAKSLGSGLSGGFGSFSAATAGLQGVSGLSKLEEASQSTADNTKKMADMMEKNPGGLKFA